MLIIVVVVVVVVMVVVAVVAVRPRPRPPCCQRQYAAPAVVARKGGREAGRAVGGENRDP